MTSFEEHDQIELHTGIYEQNNMIIHQTAGKWFLNVKISTVLQDKPLGIVQSSPGI